MKLNRTSLFRSLGYVASLIIKFGLIACIGFGTLLLAIRYLDPSSADPRTPAITSKADILAPAVYLILAAVVVRLIISRFARQLLATMMAHFKSQGSSALGDTDLRLVAMAGQTFQSRYNDRRSTKSLISNLLDPAGHFDRIKEEVDVKTSRYRKTTTLTARIEPGFVNLVPVIAQRKGSLIDDLDVEVSGQAGSTLSYIENQGAVAAVADTLFARLRASRSFIIDNPDGLRANILARISSPNAQNAREDLKVLDAARAGLSAESLTYLIALRRLLEFCSTSYFLLVPVSSETPRRIKIKISSSYDRRPGRQKVRDSARIALGLRQRDHVFSLAKALETVSYHFSLITPSGMYAYDAQIERVKVDESQFRPLPTGRARLTFPAEQLGDSTKFVHVYLRDTVSDSLATIPSARIELRERPPGLMEVSLLLSLLLLSLTWTVGRYHDFVFRADGLSGSWPTVLFGIPTLLVGWLVARIDGRSLARISFTSLAMLCWLAVNSVAAVLAAALKSADVSLTSDGYKFGSVYVAHPAWAVIMVSCAFHFVFCFTLSTSRALRYGLALNGLTTFTRKEYSVE